MSLMADSDSSSAGAGFGATLKKWGMRHFWRIQQCQMIVSMIFWATTLALLIYARLEHRVNADGNWYGIPHSWLTMGGLWFVVIIMVLLIGYIYDKTFALWKEQRTVDIERNPFATHALSPINTLVLGHLSHILRELKPDDEKVQESAEWMDKWIAHWSNQEIWIRAIGELDKQLETSTPNLFFFPQGAVDSARGKVVEEMNDCDDNTC